ncbi:ATP-binding protein, partial [Desulfothermus okinawensis]
KAKISYQEYLYKVLQNQIIVRIDNSINAKIKKAKFPFIKTIEEFDFSFQPSIDEKLIYELANLTFLNHAKNIIFVGPPG